MLGEKTIKTILIIPLALFLFYFTCFNYQIKVVRVVPLRSIQMAYLAEVQAKSCNILSSNPSYNLCHVWISLTVFF